MPKSSQTQKTSTKKKKSPVRDINPKSNKKPDAFKIRHLDDDAPSVEPLIEVETIDSEFEVSKLSEDEAASKEEEPIEEPEIKIEKIEEEVEKEIDDLKQFQQEKMGPTGEPRDTIKVRFDKFVQLILSKDIEDMIDANADQEIIMSSNLLTDLAGSEPDVKEERRTPLVFIVGIAMGIIITYLFFSS